MFIFIFYIFLNKRLGAERREMEIKRGQEGRVRKQ
jgi:hypothetical protein